VNKIDLKKMLFILGTPRSGKKLLKCLLDGHSQLLVWPDEIPYFAIFKSLEGADKKVSCDALNQILINSILKRIPNPSSKEQYLMLGDFSASKFINNASHLQNKRMSSIEYLLYIANAYYASYDRYKAINIKYFVLTCSGQGFDWSSQSLLDESTFIWVDRGIQQAYASFREKIIRSKKISLFDFFNPNLIKGAMWQFYLYELLQGKLKQHIMRDNFYLVDLEVLKKTPDKAIRDINNMIGVDYEKIQKNLTICNEYYDGNFIGKKIKSSTVINTSSELKIALTEFEIECINYIVDSKQKFGFNFHTLSSVIKTSFSNEVALKGNLKKNIVTTKMFQVLFGLILLYRLSFIVYSLKYRSPDSILTFAKDKYIHGLIN
jgi:hypothetical protein